MLEGSPGYFFFAKVAGQCTRAKLGPERAHEMCEALPFDTSESVILGKIESLCGAGDQGQYLSEVVMMETLLSCQSAFIANNINESLGPTTCSARRPRETK